MRSVFTTKGGGGGGGGTGKAGGAISVPRLIRSCGREPRLPEPGDGSMLGPMGSSTYAILSGMDSGAVRIVGSGCVYFWIRGRTEKTSTGFAASILGANKAVSIGGIVIAWV